MRTYDNIARADDNIARADGNIACADDNIARAADNIARADDNITPTVDNIARAFGASTGTFGRARSSPMQSVIQITFPVTQITGSQPININYLGASVPLSPGPGHQP